MHEMVEHMGKMFIKGFEKGAKSKESCLSITQKEKLEYFKNIYKNSINAGGKNETRAITKNI